MKSMIMIFISLMTFVVFGEQALAQKISHVQGAGCAILDEGVRCWGGEGLVNPEKVGLQLIDPTQIVVAEISINRKLGACALDQGQIKCWNDTASYPVEPSNSKIIRIFATRTSSDKAVAIEFEGGRFGYLDTQESTPVRMKSIFRIVDDFQEKSLRSVVWGDHIFGIRDGTIYIQSTDRKYDYSTEPRPFDPYLAERPQLDHPEKLWIGSDGLCVLDQRRYVCWDTESYFKTEFLNIPRDREIRSLSVYSKRSYPEVCFIEKGEVKCPGSAFAVPALKNPTEVVVDGHTYCALDDNGPTCWGLYTNVYSWSTILENPTQLMGSDGYVCAVTSKGLSCSQTMRGWDAHETGIGRYDMGSDSILGHDNYYHYTPPKLSPNFKSFGAYPYGARYCMFDVNNEFSCTGYEWKNDEQKTIDYSKVKPSAFSLGYAHICVIEKNKVRCWGSNKYKQLEIPKDLSSVTEIASGGGHSCAIGKNGIQCWGANDKGQATVPKGLKKASHLVLFGDGSCVISQGQIRCWGEIATKFDPSKLNLKNPVNMKYGDDYFCAFDDEGMKCLGEARFIKAVPWMNRILGKVFDMATADPQAGYYKTSNEMIESGYFCAIGRQSEGPAKAYCFSIDGMTTQADLMTIRMAPERAMHFLGGEFSLLSLEVKLRTLSAQVPKLQAEILKKTADYLEQNVKACANQISKGREECQSRFQDTRATNVLGARLLTLQLLEPLMQSMTSKTFKENVNPIYEQSLATSVQTLKILGIDYSTGQRSLIEKKSALAIAQFATQMAGKVVRVQEKKRMAGLLTRMVQASVNLKNPALLQAVFNEYDQQRDVFDSLKSNYQTAFLADLLDAAMKALGK